MFIKRFDVLLLLILVTARVRIDTLVDLVAPRPTETIRKVEWLDRLLPDSAWKLLADWLTDPLSLLLISITFGLVLAYVVVDLLTNSSNPKSRASVPNPNIQPPNHLTIEPPNHPTTQPPDHPTIQPSNHPTTQPPNHPTTQLPNYHLKLFLIYAIIATTVVAQTVYLIALRHVTGPAAYTHDGGVIMTEETMKFLLRGKNPYTEDYTQTPLAQWGLDYKTALYHYPYLPWTFLFALPFYLLSNATLGWFDQRFIYLSLFAIMLLLLPRLAPDPMAKWSLVMVLGLNPIMGNDIIFGQNDSFVLFWIVAALVVMTLPHRWAPATGLGLFALACASKPTAWFLAPFLLLYAIHVARTTLHASRFTFYVSRFAPFALIFLAIVLPFIVWDAYNFYDDIWAWSAGTSPTAYQMRGWGLSNFVLALNLVPSRLSYFPFWVPEVIVGVPLLLLMLRRQWRENTLANALWHGAILFFAYAFVSRFLNENYVAFVASLMALSVFINQLSDTRRLLPPDEAKSDVG